MKNVFKRGLSLVLALALCVPAFFAAEAVALTNPDYKLEPYTFTQRGEQLKGEVAFQEYTSPAASGTSFEYPSGSDEEAWVKIAKCVLDLAAIKEDAAVTSFSVFDIQKALSGTDRKGNRAMLAAYLMRGKDGGPWDGSPSENEVAKPMQPAKGIVYIPDLAVTANEAAKTVYRDRIKYGIVNYGAVGASLYFNKGAEFKDSYGGEFVNFHQKADLYSPGVSGPNDLDPTVRLYRNTSRAAADHTVAIIGWDDWFEMEYLVEKTTTTTTPSGSVTSTTIEKAAYSQGAFLVCDSGNSSDGSGMGGVPYWVSYDTILSGAYFIEGFYDPTDIPAAFTPKTQNKDGNKNPLGYTYEYDPAGVTGAQGYNNNTAYFTNVFTAAGAADVLQAVSLFLTGEGNTYDVWFVYDYKDADSIKNIDINANAVKIASGYKPLPGYYTIDLGTGLGGAFDPIPLPAKGKKFAIVAKVKCDNGNAPIPVSVSSAKAAGQGFISSDGSKWTDAYSQGKSAICLKAHVETNVEIELTGVKMPQSFESDGTTGHEYTAGTAAGDVPSEYGYASGDYPLLAVAPGSSYNLGPIFNPANATDILTKETKIYAFMQFEDMELDSDSDWVVKVDADKKPEMRGPAEWLVYNDAWKRFVPQGDPDIPGHPDNKYSQAGTSAPTVYYEDGDKKVKVDSKDLTQPFTVTDPAKGPCTAKISTNDGYFNKGPIPVKMEVKTGFQKLDGTFEKDDNDSTKNKVKWTWDTAKGYIEIKHVAVAKITLDRTDLKLKANASTTLKAALKSEDEKTAPSPRKVIWCVAPTAPTVNAAGGYEYATYTGLDNVPANSYSDKAPHAIVSSAGKVTALSDGTCWVYAKVIEGTEEIVSNPCKVTVEKVVTTGIKINKKKYTMSKGTFLTLLATVKPASASNKQVEWSLKDGSDMNVVTIDKDTGVMEAIGVGVTTIVASTDGGKHKAECVITVAEGPTATVKKGKAYTLSVLGAPSKAIVTWDGPSTSTPPADPDNPVFTGAKSGTSKYKLTAADIGSTVMTGTVMSPTYNADGSINETVTVPTQKQSWHLEAVIAISKLQFVDQADTVTKKLTLCVESDLTNGQSFTLTSKLVKPTDATLLGYVWSAKIPKDGKDIIQIDGANNINPATGTNDTVTITALRPGSTKLTALNYNGKKKASITIKVLLYPKSITVKQSKFTINPGKKANVKGKVSAKNTRKDLRYYLYDESGTTLLTGYDENGNPKVFVESEIAVLELKKGKLTGKLTALAEGKVKVEVRGAPFDATAAKSVIDIEIKPKAPKK